ncbi:MAG: hypothetical protein ACHQXA_10880, partial [Gemmatimonadales bacterium]
MPRCLSVSRATVTPERESEYLATAGDLARALEQRGQHLWVFRSDTDPGTFIEFSESPSAASHRTRASRLPKEQRLEARLRALASYAPDAWALWE